MTRTALALAFVLAWAVARLVPSPRQWAIAATLAGLLSLDVLRMGTAPYQVVHVAAFVGWYALSASCAWVVLDVDERGAVDYLVRGSVPLLSALIILAGSALAVRFGLTMELSRLAFALALAAQVLAALRFVSRGRWPDDAQRVALILVASSVVDATPGPWLLGMPARDWAVGRWIAVVTWLAIAGWEMRCLIRAHRSPE